MTADQFDQLKRDTLSKFQLNIKDINTLENQDCIDNNFKIQLKMDNDYNN